MDIRTEPLALCQIILQDYLKVHPAMGGRWQERPWAHVFTHHDPKIRAAAEALGDLARMQDNQLIDGIPAFLRKLTLLSLDMDKNNTPIVDFHGQHSKFSNFSPWHVNLHDGAPVAPDFYDYPSVEHAFVAAKCANLAQRCHIDRRHQRWLLLTSTT